MTAPAVQTAVVDVFLALQHPDTGQILFGLRAAHLYAGGQYNLISGKAEPGESAVEGLLREAREEAGVRLQACDVRPLGAVHTVGGAGQPRIGLVFTAVHDAARHGPVVNAEPDKCGELIWADPARPPQPLETYNAAALALVTSPQLGIVTHGWPGDSHRMGLQPHWFDLVRSGAKTVELRLVDERRSALHPGQLITFSTAIHCSEHTARITWLRRFPSVKHVLEFVPAEAIGGPGATSEEVAAAYDGIYGQRAQSGDVLAIGLAAALA